MLPILRIGSLQLPTFFLVISLSLCILLFWLSARLQQSRFRSFSRVKAFNLALIIMIFGFLGGRLLHVFYEEWFYYLINPTEIFKFWKGGFVFYGGFLTALFGSWVYLRTQKEQFLPWADFFTPLLSASYALGRLGCFFEGCCYGKYCELPWAVARRHPTQIYMLVTEVFLLLFILYKEKQNKTHAGTLFFTWILLHSATRFIIEFFRDDDRGRMLLNLSVSQWLSLFIFITTLVCLKTTADNKT